MFQTITSSAQTILTGTVRDAKNQPLPGILLEAETKVQPPATAFVISAADGSFTLTLPATPASDSLRLSARALGYAAQLVRLANRSQLRALTSKRPKPPGSAPATGLRKIITRWSCGRVLINGKLVR